MTGLATINETLCIRNITVIDANKETAVGLDRFGYQLAQ
jgi:hypothetical protein